MLFSRLSASLVALAAFSLATAIPIDSKLQPIIAAKNNLGFVNPPSANSNAAVGLSPGFIAASAISAASIVAILL
ncbi:hypothetical protein C8J57DRAFT_1495578 [Mycena rebaudengoi]|nr:hypothetical protein C8J57DRAFT_1495578 [Mycena rebaudengoi]